MIPSRRGLIALYLSQAASAFTVTILAETNRDGVVDNLDLKGKNNWIADHGALFLANIVDTDRRCSLEITRQTTDAALELCHDDSDDIIRNPLYLASLATLPINGLSADAQGFVSVVDPYVATNVRIFHKATDGKWIFIKANHAFTTEEIEQGLELGIDARDVRQPNGWDGHVTVHFTVSTGPQNATKDTVALRVAPVLTHHHAQTAERVFVTRYTTGPQGQFVEDLRQNFDAIMPVQELRNASEIWTQDFFETGYSSIPGPDGPIALSILLRSAQLFRTVGRAVFLELRDGNVGADYPAGRVILGRQFDQDPKILSFLQAQETQELLRLDTDWLAVGHVDEFLQFLPADNERGWVLIADDPLKGLATLEKAVADGHGNERAFSRPSFSYDGGQCAPKLSISQVLALKNFIDANRLAADRITANLEILKHETGITDDEIFRLPATFYDQDPGCGTSNKIASVSSNQGMLNIIEAATPPNTVERRQSTGSFVRSLFAFYPGIVNGVVLTNSTVLSPNPWGPIIDGKDVFRTEAENVYAEVGYNVIWQDD